MIIKELKSFYIVNKIKEHKDIKNKLLDLIAKIPTNNFITKRENILHTDWNLPKDYKRDYLDFFYQIIAPYMEDITKHLYCSNWYIRNGWFQQYKKNNEHSWHNHCEANYSNIYYLEMPDKNMRTELYNIVTKKIITLDVKEGDFLMFPAHILHRSKKLKTSKRKTIISFNSDFSEVTL